VRFDPGWGGPAAVEFQKLESWTSRSEPGIRYYSGTATYVKRFDVPNIVRGRRLSLDLGAVANVAAVRLNGRNLGVVWTEPFQVDITALFRRAGNILEVRITNLWPNRLIGDAALPPAERITHTNIGFDPRAPLLESGLLGPVRILAAEA
jgi:hypothetical protein